MLFAEAITTENLLIAAVTVLSGAVGVLFKLCHGAYGKLEVRLDKTEVRLAECEDDREALWRQLGGKPAS